MESLKSYVICVLLAAAISGIIKTLSSGMKGFEKYVGFVASLVIILVLARPLTSVVGGALEEISKVGSVFQNSQNDPQESEKSEDIMSCHVKSALEETVKDVLCKRFGISESDIKVIAFLSDDMSVEKVVIYTVATNDLSEIESYVEKSLLISAEVRSEMNEE